MSADSLPRDTHNHGMSSTSLNGQNAAEADTRLRPPDMGLRKHLQRLSFG